MLSLQEASLLKLIEDKNNLNEVLDVCKSSAALGNVCGSSKKFWMAALARLGYSVEVLCFEPLKEKYWLEFVRGLGKSISYQKVFENLYDIDPGKSRQLFYPASSNFDLDGIGNTKISIPSLDLSKGTSVWVVEFRHDDQVNRMIQPSEYVVLLCSKDKDDTDRILDVCTELILKHLKSLDGVYLIQTFNGEADPELEINVEGGELPDALKIKDILKKYWGDSDYISEVMETGLMVKTGPHMANQDINYGKPALKIPLFAVFKGIIA